MKRRYGMCHECDRMMSCWQDGKEIGCFCRQLEVEPSMNIRIENGEFVMYGGRTKDSVISSRENWDSLDVPRDCEFYAERFMEECNEEKIQ